MSCTSSGGSTRCTGPPLPESAAADAAALLRHVARTQKRRVILLLVCDEEDASPELTAALRRAVVQHDVLVVTVGDLDPVAVPAGAPDTSDVDSGWRLPAWVREDERLAAELSVDRAARRHRLHEELAQLGVVHEHLDPGDSPLAVVRRLLLRHRHARRR